MLVSLTMLRRAERESLLTWALTEVPGNQSRMAMSKARASHVVLNFDSPMVALNLLALNRQECSVADALTMEGTCIGRAPILAKGSMKENQPKGVHGHEVP